MAISDQPSPAQFFAGVQGYQHSAALKGAIDLGLFTHIASGSVTAPDLAARCRASERGMRMLCDFLVAAGFLTKTQRNYGLTRDSAVFLDRNSPQFLGNIVDFLLSPFFIRDIGDVAAAVRRGGVVTSARGSDEPSHPMWVDFARAMTGLQRMPAQQLADAVSVPSHGSVRVLDVAAGSGVFGIALAQRHANVEVTAVDWGSVLQVAEENARAAGVAGRHRSLAGNAFDVDLGGPYEVVLVTHFLHHFDMTACVTFLRRAEAVLADAGRIYVVDFVPNEDRVSPPEPAMFALQMLRQTPSGDTYTASQFRDMFRQAGLQVRDVIPMGGAPYSIVCGGR